MSNAESRTYMVIEHFAPENVAAVYARFREKGRMVPQGLHYVDSWLSADQRRCFQLMETADPALFDTWVERWHDLVTFEIVEIGEKPA